MSEATLTFDNNALFAQLCGPTDSHLLLIEQRLGVKALPRGNTVRLSGPDDAVTQAHTALNALYGRLQAGEPVEVAEVEAALRFADAPSGKASADGPVLSLQKRAVSARTDAQAQYMRQMQENELVFGVGPAGTGKTYLGVVHAAYMLLTKRVDKIILSRPAVEAGERIGFLPGDMKEKVDPYLRPLYDALYDVLQKDYVDKKIAAEEIEIAPLAFMRGRTLARSVVLLDEAQNASIAQMKMFLTRLGEGSMMIVTGDPSQTDLPDPRMSGLGDAVALLKDIEGVATTTFTGDDVVRHRLVREIVGAYDTRERARMALAKKHQNQQ